MDAQSQPPQPATVFQWELCADLHNRILDLGWAVVSEEMDYEPSTESWWEHQFGGAGDSDDGSEDNTGDEGDEGGDAVELETRLHPDVVSFLKTARHDYPGPADSCHFFYYLRELTRPDDIINVLNDDPGTGLCMNRRDRHVWLYTLPNFQPGGLLLDQQTMKAMIIIYPDLYKIRDPDDLPWTPLEEILSSFLEMIEQRRIIAIPIDSDVNNPEEPREWEEDRDWYVPWIVSEEDDKIVDDTIAAWNSLLTAIESRIPGFEDSEYNTYESQSIDDCEIKGFFIPKFIRKLRIPEFRYVAPGLRLSNPDELADQPFKKLDLAPLLNPGEYLEYGFKWYPFLFLRADRKLSNTEGKYHDHPWGRAPEYETGLYLENTKTVERSDGCKLLLPFTIKSGKCARYSDLQVIMDHQSHEGLYQPGWNMILQVACQRLEPLFKNWASMVEQGHWQVDENGVVGDIEKFKEADTPDKWNLYVIKRTW